MITSDFWKDLEPADTFLLSRSKLYQLEGVSYGYLVIVAISHASARNFKKYVWDLDKDSSLVKEMNRFKTFGRKRVADFIEQNKCKSKTVS